MIKILKKPHRESGGCGSKEDAKREAAQVFKCFHTWSNIYSGFQNDSNFEVFLLSLFQKMIDKLKSMGPNNGPALVVMQITTSKLASLHMTRYQPSRSWSISLFKFS